jgi:LacI family transcriptional regulator
VSLLFDMLQSSAIRDVRYVLETHLVVRETTRPAPGAAGGRSKRPG